MESTRLTAIRHGETAWNVDTRIQGQLDIPLNERGQLQAELAGQSLSDDAIDVAYTSDLYRAYATALAVAKPHGIHPITHPDLRERGFGDFQGKTFKEIERQWPDQALSWRRRVPDFSPSGGGESLLLFRQRVLLILADVCRQHLGRHVLVVAHGGVMDVLYRSATRLELDAPRTWSLDNGAINRVLWTPTGGFALVGWNDKSHLGDALDEGAA